MSSSRANIYQLPESTHSSANRPKLSLPSGVFLASADSTSNNASSSANFAARALNTDLTNIISNTSGNSSLGPQKPVTQTWVDRNTHPESYGSNQSSLTTNQNTPSYFNEPKISNNTNRPALSISMPKQSQFVPSNSIAPSSVAVSGANYSPPFSHKTSSSISSKQTLSPPSDHGSHGGSSTARSSISSISSSDHESCNISMSIPVLNASSTIIPPENVLSQNSIASSPNNIPPQSTTSPTIQNQGNITNLMPPFPFPVKKSPSKTVLAALSIPVNPNVQQKNYVPDPVPFQGTTTQADHTSAIPSSLHSDDSSHSSSDGSEFQNSSFLEPASTGSSNNTLSALSVTTPLSRPSNSPSSSLNTDMPYLETGDGGFRTDSTVVVPRSSTSASPNCSIGNIALVGNIGSIGGAGSVIMSNKLSLNAKLDFQSEVITSSGDMDTNTLTKGISTMNIETYNQEQRNYAPSTTYTPQGEYPSNESCQGTISQIYGSPNTKSIETASTFTSSYSSAPKLRPSNYEKYAQLDVQDLDEEGWRSVAAAGDIEELGRLGEGAGGSVTRCRLRGRDGRNGHGSVFALKAITTNPNPEVQKQILRELQFNRSCNSPHIVKYYGTFLSEETASIFIAMEYCGGGSLEAIYKRVKVRGGRIGEKVLGKIAEGVLSGLSYLHERRIIHRDIKPQNILLGSEGQVKLCDFGVSGEVVNSLATTFTGTSYYMAPERIQGQPYTVTSDVWSLGLTIMEVAQHRFPFLPENHEPLMPIELLSIIVNMPAPEIKDEPEEGIKWSESFRHFLKSCLEKDPKKRASPRQMLGHPWIVGQRNKTVKMAKFVRECWS